MACAGTDPIRTGDMVTLSIKADRILPKADLEIPVFSSVCWFNAMEEAGKTAFITILSPMWESEACSSTFGFELHAESATTQKGIAPLQCAVMCFHVAGEFTYRIEGTDKTLEGMIRVVARDR